MSNPNEPKDAAPADEADDEELAAKKKAAADGDADDWSGAFHRNKIHRDDGGASDIAGYVAEGSAQDAPPEGGHEAWSRSDQANLWARGKERWQKGAEGSERGEREYSTDGLEREGDAKKPR